ncbi:hypothetical protein E1295_02345 [Nonomuraea mesophila]|uniref:HEXXH motif domain-containing protein n=1 Tax=Nonomuraea mesophila TaxID=2530382 RepID=A0A4V2ZBT6_9ACTN|nr:HEXXH motif domain-containing protein [Nonomuraea mesophila]TDE59748.1 hypothetical protein E1295_02345 [Nonomuraea mesophila]
MNGVLMITSRDLQALATGRDELAMVTILRVGQLGKHALLLRAIMHAGQQNHPEEYAASGYEAAYDLLASAQEAHGEVVTSLLLHPQTAAWAHACLRLTQDLDADPGHVREMLGGLGGVAAAAAIRAGIEFELAAPLRRGALLLPTFGQACFPTSGSVTIRNDGQGASLTSGDTTVKLPADHREDSPGWLGLREITAESAGVRLKVDLDDLGPDRAMRTGVAGRLDADAVGRWSDRVRRTWILMVAVSHKRAVSTAEVLATLIPQAEREGESASTRDAFGAVQLTECDHPGTLAETLVHEAQHSKLNALLDLCPLLHEDDGRLYYSPARSDARPVHGLLHATYAFFGITDFWRQHRHLDQGTSRAYPHFQFAMAREQCLIGTGTLLESGMLNTDGLAFVASMDATLRSWGADEEVPEPYATWARAAILDHRLLWKLNNLHHHADTLLRLAKAWIAGEPAPHAAGATEQVIRQWLGVSPSYIRLKLRYVEARSPQSGERLYADLKAEVRDANDADLAFIHADHTTAARLYAERIVAGSDDVTDWAGLALALQGSGCSGSLATQPQLVRAVYNHIGDLQGPRQDPRALAAWLDGTLDDVL